MCQLFSVTERLSDLEYGTLAQKCTICIPCTLLLFTPHCNRTATALPLYCLCHPSRPNVPHHTPVLPTGDSHWLGVRHRWCPAPQLQGQHCCPNRQSAGVCCTGRGGHTGQPASTLRGERVQGFVAKVCCMRWFCCGVGVSLVLSMCQFLM